MDVSEIFRRENPPGTKFLVELEVVDVDGYNKLMSAVCLEKENDKFEEHTGTRVNKVYKKDISVDNINMSIEDILKNALIKVQELKQKGYEI